MFTYYYSKNAEKCALFLFVALTVVLFSGSAPVFAGSDPGIPDTVKITGGPLIVGQSIPLDLSIINDEELESYVLGFIYNQSRSSGGRVAFDSVVYVNRMADPSVMQYRMNRRLDNSDNPPDSILFGGTKLLGNSLPLGNSTVAKLFFTGLDIGSFYFDSSSFGYSTKFELFINGGGGVLSPQYFLGSIEVIEKDFPPEVSLSEDIIRGFAGDIIEFSVAAVSPQDYPVTIEISAMTDYDDETELPTNPPVFNGISSGEFSWESTSDDIGIWSVTIEACDSTGLCSFEYVEIQILKDRSFDLDFEISQTSNVCHITGLITGNFDDDSYPEVVASGSGLFDQLGNLELYDWNTEESLSLVFDYSGYHSMFGPQSGFINNDNLLDIIGMVWHNNGGYRTTVFFGDSANILEYYGATTPGNPTSNTAFSELTGDAYLDFVACENEFITIYAGNAQTQFIQTKRVSVGEKVLSVNTADFNNDNKNDLAVGTISATKIYLANESRDFILTHQYSQIYGAIDIEVTNNGSDFNNDAFYDLCISTPSVGGEYSNIYLYLGDGMGAFSQEVIRRVKGQIFGNCVGDFNNDNQLDIAFVNGTGEYISILLGDGAGQFANEIRYPILHENPAYISCTDIDLDGDLDIIIAALGSTGGQSLFTLLNQYDPGQFVKRPLNISAIDNTNIELVSSQGKVFNQYMNTMPSATMYYRDLNGNEIIDNYAKMGLVESSGYTLHANPKSNFSAGDKFSLEFELDGQIYRLAKDMDMPENGHTFFIDVNNNAGILPLSGKFIGVNPPVFSWQENGDCNFQLASDFEFENLVIDVLVEGNIYSPSFALGANDTTAYYWRVKSVDTPSYGNFYAINLLPGLQIKGDINGDNVTNLSDVIYYINYVFGIGTSVDLDCRADLNCDSRINIGDIIYLVNYIFKGGSAPCASCP